MRILKRNFFKDETQSFPHEPVPAWGPRVITVTSGKGGVGKTSLTVNLAIALVQLGQRVIIFDADLGLANVDVLLDVAPSLTLYDHIYRDVPIEDILLPGPGGIKIISGGSGFLELTNLSSSQRAGLLKNIEKLNRMADFVLIDTGAGISKDVLAFCAAADDVFMVITPEPTSLADAYGLIKVLDRFKVHRELFFVVNQTHNDRETSHTVERLRAVVDNYLTIKLNYLGDIWYDQAVSRAVKNQRPFILSDSNARAAIAVKKIAHAILHKEWATEEERGLRGFVNKLSRLFR
ncbi:MinD/ParA family protein [Desulfoscipio geothermicus]|uniref:Flagellar biosynthesis protein FlhG n=1 Tax=Desulfoscipio geothermicus DSM 3669 TaxID=1121426 RepID=A0A1I6CVD7_9FIRM|nr:MinD/ParA family protein [Desulfoscipio geothermicus]SFQ97120.1 flagellar biosynthesis protein FlhG [Desulfoscipio geothermicus DSM 3669]